MEFYPVELMSREIKNLENEIERVEKESKDERFIQACRFVNETRVIDLKSAISFLVKAESIPIVDE